MRCVLGVALLAGLGLAAGCEALWGGLSIPAPENCALGGNPCPKGQICSPITQLCQDELTFTEVTPARAPTSAAQTPLLIRGTNFAPGMSVKWNGVKLGPVSVDSATTLRVTAPMSSGDWRVQIELQSPSGLTVSRTDLFSYYSTAVSFQTFVPPVPSFQGTSVLGVAPLLTATSAGMILGSGTGQLRALLLGSTGQTVSELWTAVGPQNTNALLVGELNGDRVRDIVIGASSGFYWSAGNADLSFQNSALLYSGVMAGASLGIGDLDGDGAAEIVGVDLKTNQVAVLSADGKRSSALPVGALSLGAVAVGQLDGQGGDDIAVTYKGTVDHLSLFRGGSGAPVDVSLAACKDGLVQVGRFTSGPARDLLLACADRVQLLAGAGDGTFTAGTPFLIALPSGQEVGAPLLADFDGDGDLDVVLLQLAAAGAPRADLYLLENSDGRGSLAARSLGISVATTVSALMAVGDVNNDGKPDVVLSERLSAATTPLTVLLNASR